ncbi:hypothetical protein KEJ18_01795 [Candidatus Bathyarchaeota archaeon]|nr:hypothetical protein [Candidatus Bathyarchaeota archaeon]
MNPLTILPFILLGAPFTPVAVEFFRRKDKGPKEIPEQTTYEEKPDVDTPLLEKAREEARVKVAGEVIRITGDASIPDGTEINNHLVVQGNLKIGKKCHIYGSVKAFGSVEIGQSTIVEGHVLSEGIINIGRDCIVKGVVDSLKDITLEENAIVEAVSTEKTVKIGPNAKINRRVLSGSQIITSLKEPQVEVIEKSKEPEISPQPQATIQPPIVETPPTIISKPKAEEEVKVPFEVLDPNIGHLYFFAPTRYGKTFMIGNYVIPQIQGKKRIVVIDPHGEYMFNTYEVSYDKTIPQVDSDMFKTFVTFNVWADVDRTVKEMLNTIRQTTGNLSIRFNIVDSNVEKIIISEFLKRITQIVWETPLLLIVEEADKYEVVSTVSRGRHANIQVILTSTRKLMPEIFTNVHLVLGNINPALIEDYDHIAAREVAKMGKYEFIWEKDYHEWRKFRLGQLRGKEVPLPEEKLPPVPQVVEPVFGVLTPERPAEPARMTKRIFSYLEDRIRKFDEAKPSVEVEYKPEDLSPVEAKVFKAALRCSAIEEICLRLLMDTAEVETVLDSLVKKGYLDKNLKPRKPSSKELATPETSEQSQTQTAAIGKSLEDVRTGQEQLTEKEYTEKLITSKLREGSKSKIQVQEEKPFEQNRPRDILDEWNKFSSLLWPSEKKEETKDTGSSEKPQKNEPANTSEKKPQDSKKLKKEPFTAEDAINELKEL